MVMAPYFNFLFSAQEESALEAIGAFFLKSMRRTKLAGSTNHFKLQDTLTWELLTRENGYCEMGCFGWSIPHNIFDVMHKMNSSFIIVISFCASGL